MLTMRHQSSQRTVRISATPFLGGVVVLVFAACRDATPSVTPSTNLPKAVAPVLAAVPGVGSRFPHMTLRTLAGDSIRLGVGAKQKLTLVNMWATWCGPCKAEFPDLQGLQEKYGPRGLRLIAVSTDQDDAKVRAFVMSTNATFLIGRDTAEDVLAFLRDGSLPQNILIGPDGRIVYKAFGLRRPIDPALIAAIDSALAGA
jgi:cytochrome c biogenesis protein CcmG, thiol:disulfide interchange protein DsbE